MNKFRTTANSGRRGGELDIVIDRKTAFRWEAHGSSEEVWGYPPNRCGEHLTPIGCKNPLSPAETSR